MILLSMNGSKSIKERYFLLNNIDKIIFNSKWSKKRFFIGICLIMRIFYHKKLLFVINQLLESKNKF